DLDLEEAVRGTTRAVIEMAAASGLMLVAPEKRNPLLASSFGTGELIRHALDNGIRHIILGIGGSATVDGGMGMAQALGVRFLDADGQPLAANGGNLAR
ncbi:glycerate kinase, partial [Pseudomonas aeruginosa]|uniref:glycerate kinase n=1 Tax=Pseudomonas aeruginosa TaxID=287 RepID=UPI0031B688D0